MLTVKDVTTVISLDEKEIEAVVLMYIRERKLVPETARLDNFRFNLGQNLDGCTVKFTHREEV